MHEVVPAPCVLLNKLHQRIFKQYTCTSGKISLYRGIKTNSKPSTPVATS